MKIGCGLVVKTRRGHRYIYLWFYRNSNGKSKKFERYIGPVRSVGSREKAIRALLEYQEKTRNELDRKIARYKVALRRFH